MSDGHAEWKERVKECESKARAMMDSAANAITDEMRDEYLKLALEWLRLATEFGSIQGD